MTNLGLGSSLRSHLWLICRFVYQLACCRAKIVLLGEVDSKSVTESLHFKSIRVLSMPCFHSDSSVQKIVSQNLTSVFSKHSDDVPMTCGGCDLSVAHENCILTLASVAQINKMSECFTQLQACYRKFCLFRNLTAFTKPELVKYDPHTWDTMQVSAVSDHCPLNME